MLHHEAESTLVPTVGLDDLSNDRRKMRAAAAADSCIDLIGMPAVFEA